MFPSSSSKACGCFHPTDIDVEPHLEIERLGVDTIAHRLEEWGGKLAMLYQTRWVGSASILWE